MTAWRRRWLVAASSLPRSAAVVPRAVSEAGSGRREGLLCS